MAHIEVTIQKVPNGPYTTQVFPANSADELEDRLRKQGVACIGTKVVNTVSDPHPAARAKVGVKHLLFFYRDVEINTRLRMPLLTVLSKAARAVSNVRLRSMIKTIEDDISSNGQDVVTAMNRFPRTFDEVACGLVQASTRGGGDLSQGFRRIYQITKRKFTIRKKLLAMTYYPGFLTFASIVLTIWMCIAFVPVILDFYGSNASKIPPATQNMIAVYNFGKEHGIIALMIAAAVIYTVTKVPGLIMSQPRLHMYVLRVPLMGSFIRKLTQATFARTYTQLSEASVPIEVKLRLCRNLSPFYPYRAALAWAAINATNGEPFYDCLDAHTFIFDRRVVESLRAGEEGGSSGEIMQSLVDIKEEELDEALETMSSIGPVLGLFVAAVPVGFVLMAVYMALFGLQDAVG